MLKETTGWNSSGNGTDDYGFSWKPSGIRTDFNNSNAGITENSYGWTSTESAGINGIYKFGHFTHDNLNKAESLKNLAMTVRCVLD
jgi:uncharacterized protein (TIGR02145 family)